MDGEIVLADVHSYRRGILTLLGTHEVTDPQPLEMRSYLFYMLDGKTIYFQSRHEDQAVIDLLEKNHWRLIPVPVGAGDVDTEYGQWEFRYYYPVDENELIPSFD